MQSNVAAIGGTTRSRGRPTGRGLRGQERKRYTFGGMPGLGWEHSRHRQRRSWLQRMFGRMF
jgi:hypothetical protein